jgi:hypothetical protein
MEQGKLFSTGMAYLKTFKGESMQKQKFIQLLIFLIFLGITFKILHSQEVSLEGYGFKIYMEDSQK